MANDLMAGHEGKADDVLEVAGAATVQGGEIGATDAGEAGTEPHPSRSRKIEGVDLDQFQRSDTHTFARADECRGRRGRLRTEGCCGRIGGLSSHVSAGRGGQPRWVRYPTGPSRDRDLDE